MARNSKMFWHVPSACWYNSSPVALGGIANVGADIVTTLVNTESGEGDVPVNDNFVIERIVGQYMLTGDEVVPTNHFLHSRVYVSDSDSTAIALRSLNTADDAETSFLWHQVDPWHSSWNGDAIGAWQSDGVAGSPFATPWKGRLGHVDIKVGRRIEAGSSLIWHTQIQASPGANDVFYLKLWLRMLCREM